MRLRSRRRVPWDLRRVEAKLKRLEQRRVMPRADTSEAERRLAELLRTVSGPVTESLLRDFDRLVDSFVPHWKAEVHRAFQPYFSELELMEIMVAPHVQASATMATDDDHQLSSLDIAVTDALYRMADDDQPLQNPLRHDRLRANPPHPSDPSPGA